MRSLIQVLASADEDAIWFRNIWPSRCKNRSRLAQQRPHVLSYVRADWRQDDGLRFNELEEELAVHVTHAHLSVRVTNGLVLEKSRSQRLCSTKEERIKSSFLNPLPSSMFVTFEQHTLVILARFDNLEVQGVIKDSVIERVFPLPKLSQRFQALLNPLDKVVQPG